MSLHNDNALVVALDTSTDMLACAEIGRAHV